MNASQHEPTHHNIGGYTFPTLVGEAWEAASPDLETSFENENLTGLFLTGINFRGAICAAAELDHTTISLSDMSNSNMRSVSGNNLMLSGVCLTGSSWQYANLSDFEAARCTGTNIDFCFATLHGSLFDCNKFHDSQFIGTDLTNASFKRTSFRTADFTEANLNGTNFHDITIIEGTTVNFTDSNVTGKQVEDLLGNKNAATRLRYNRHSIEDVAAATGWDSDEIAVRIWAGDIEIRDNRTQTKVVGSFDAQTHHIPQWATTDLLATSNK